MTVYYVTCPNLLPDEQQEKISRLFCEIAQRTIGTDNSMHLMDEIGVVPNGKSHPNENLDSVFKFSAELSELEKETIKVVGGSVSATAPQGYRVLTRPRSQL